MTAVLFETLQDEAYAEARHNAVKMACGECGRDGGMEVVMHGLLVTIECPTCGAVVDEYEYEDYMQPCEAAVRY